MSSDEASTSYGRSVIAGWAYLDNSTRGRSGRLEDVATIIVPSTSAKHDEQDYNGDADSARDSVTANCASYAVAVPVLPQASVLARVLHAGHTLELRWLKLVKGGHANDGSSSMQDDSEDDDEFELDETPVRLAFAGTIIPGLSITYSSDTGSLELLVYTTGPSICYRIAFEAPSFFHAEQPLPENWCTQHAVSSPVLLGKAYDADFSYSNAILVSPLGNVSKPAEGLAIATTDGTLACLQWIAEEHRFYEYELRPDASLGSALLRSWIPSRFIASSSSSSRLQSIASPARSGPSYQYQQQYSARPLVSSSVSSSPSQIVSMVADTSGLLPEYIFTISRERKLKAWSTASRACIQTLSVPTSPQTMEIVPIIGGASDRGATPAPNATGEATAGLLAQNPRPLLRFIPSLAIDASGVLTQPALLVYIPTANVQTSFFILYAISLDVQGSIQSIYPLVEKPCDFALDTDSSSIDSNNSTSATAYNTHLADFITVKSATTASQPLSSVDLWTLWSEDGTSVLRRTNIVVPSDALVMASPKTDTREASPAEESTSEWMTVIRSPCQDVDQLDAVAAQFDLLITQRMEAQADSAGSEQVSSQAEAAHRLTVLCKQAAVQSFLKHIFAAPRRFPTSGTAAALLAYIESITRNAEVLPSNTSLAQQALDYVSSHVRVEVDPDTGGLKQDEYVKRFKGEWLRFTALCEEARRSAALPLALTALHSTSASKLPDIVLGLAQEAVILPAYSDDLVNLLQTSGYGIVGIAQSTNNGRIPDVVRTVFQTAASLSQALLSDANSSVLSDFEQAALSVITAPLQLSLEDVAADLYESHLEPCIDDALQMRTSEALSSFSSSQSLASIIAQALHLLTTTDKTIAEESTDHQPASTVATQLVVDLASTAIAARYRLALAMLVLSLFVQGELVHPDPDTSVTDSELVTEDEVSDVLDAACSTLRALNTANYLASHNVAMTDLDLDNAAPELRHGGAGSASPTGLLNRLSSLQVRKAPSSSRGHSAGSYGGRTDGVLRILTESMPYHVSMQRASDSLVQMLSSATSLIGSLGLVGNQLQKGSAEDEYSALSTAQVAATLRQSQLPLEALSVIAMHPDEEDNAALLHLQGLIAIERGDGDVAEAAFIQVAAAIYVNDSSLSVLTRIVDSEDCTSLDAYYRLVAGIFEQNHSGVAIARFFKLAIDAHAAQKHNEGDSSAWLKDAWYKAFRAYTSSGAFDEAYTMMASMPFADTQRDCLRHLIATMCDAGQADVLLAYPFASLHQEVEKILNFRARNADPTAPPDYYKILYAWHSSRIDHRSASAVMYQRAKRLSSMSDSVNAPQILAWQCQSYLAAINSLRLVQPDKQWILIDVKATAGDNSSSRKRQRVLDAPVPDPSRITLSFIEREYTLVLSRLQLAQHFPELARTGHHIDATGVVALFTQVALFEMALQTALALSIEKAPIFEQMASRCIQLSRAQAYSSESPTDNIEWITNDPKAGQWEGSLPSRAWRLLELSLSRYDDTPCSPITGNGRRAVLDTILRLDRWSRLPRFLTEWFMRHHPEHLIWKLVEYDRLEEACTLAMRLLNSVREDFEKAVLQDAGNSSAPKSAGCYLPYNLFDQILAVDLDDETEKRRQDIEAVQEGLRVAIRQQSDRIEKFRRQLL